MTYSRREAIALGGSSLAVVLAGCQNSTSSEDPPLNLKITNYTPDPQEIEVKVVDPTEGDASDALAYSTTEAAQHIVEIPPETDGEEDSYTVRNFEDIADLRRYTVYARLPQSGPNGWRHFHYVPPEDQGYYGIFIRIYLDEDANDTVIEFDNI